MNDRLLPPRALDDEHALALLREAQHDLDVRRTVDQGGSDLGSLVSRVIEDHRPREVGGSNLNPARRTARTIDRAIASRISAA